MKNKVYIFIASFVLCLSTNSQIIIASGLNNYANTLKPLIENALNETTTFYIHTTEKQYRDKERIPIIKVDVEKVDGSNSIIYNLHSCLTPNYLLNNQNNLSFEEIEKEIECKYGDYTAKSTNIFQPKGIKVSVGFIGSQEVPIDDFHNFIENQDEDFKQVLNSYFSNEYVNSGMHLFSGSLGIILTLTLWDAYKHTSALIVGLGRTLMVLSVVSGTLTVIAIGTGLYISYVFTSRSINTFKTRRTLNGLEDKISLSTPQELANSLNESTIPIHKIIKAFEQSLNTSELKTTNRNFNDIFKFIIRRSDELILQ